MHEALQEALKSVKPVYLADVLRPKAPPRPPQRDPDSPERILEEMPLLERAPSFYVMSPHIRPTGAPHE